MFAHKWYEEMYPIPSQFEKSANVNKTNKVKRKGIPSLYNLRSEEIKNAYYLHKNVESFKTYTSIQS